MATIYHCSQTNSSYKLPFAMRAITSFILSAPESHFFPWKYLGASFSLGTMGSNDYPKASL